MILCPVTKPFGIELTKLVPSWDEFHRSVWSASSLRKHARNVISPRSLFRPLAFRGHCLRLSLFAFLTPAGSRMHVLCVCIMPTTTLLGYNITLEASWIHAGMQTIRHRSLPPSDTANFPFLFIFTCPPFLPFLRMREERTGEKSWNELRFLIVPLRSSFLLFIFFLYNFIIILSRLLEVSIRLYVLKGKLSLSNRFIL